MTISSTTNRAGPYTGNGVTTAFAFNPPFHSTADLVVIETIIATGVQTTKTLTTHYTVSGTADTQGHYPSGGTVNAVTAPASTVTWTIYRDLTLTQASDWVEGDADPAEVKESAFDKLTMIALRLRELVTRSLRQPDGDAADVAVMPSKVARASAYLAFDANGDPIASPAVAGSAVVSAYMATVLDDANAAAARATLGSGTTGDALFTAATAAAANITLGTNFPGVCDFRLTLTTGLPVTTGDVTGATTIYCTPYKGNRIALYDGTNWNVRSSAEFSLALGTLSSGKPYDVFCYDNAGVPTLEFLVWTNDTTRATALTLQNGVLVKTGAVTRRYMGTFYTTATTTTEDSAAKRFLWNYYHRAKRPMRVVEATDSWTYTTATIRQARASTSNQLDMVVGVSEDVVTALVHAVVACGGGAAAGDNLLLSGIGLDSTTVNSAKLLPGYTNVITNRLESRTSAFSDFVGAGRHFLAWLEYSGTTGTTTWYGDNGAATLQQSGISGELMA